MSFADATTRPDDLPDIDALWDHGDPAGAEQKFMEILGRLEHTGEQSAAYRAELLTQLARTHGRRRNFTEAHAILDQARKMLTGGMKRAETRYLLERGRAFNSAGQTGQALPLFYQAAAVAEAEKQIRLLIDAIHMIAIAEARPEDQLRWNLTALAIVENNPSERGWLWSLYNNTAESYLALKHYDHALEYFQNISEYLREREQQDVFVQKDIAKCLRMLGRLEEAAAIIRPIYDDLNAKGNESGTITAEMAECLLGQHRDADAKALFARAYELLKDDDWMKSKEPAILERYKNLGGAHAGVDVKSAAPPSH